jgi:hypothetical protein
MEYLMQSYKKAFALLCILTLFGILAYGENALSQGLKSDSAAELGTQAIEQAISEKGLTPEQRVERIENILESIKQTGERTEDRSYYNKMVSRELVAYIKIMILVLLLIALTFPLTIWFMSRKRLLGLSGLSSELAATLLVIEERQAKLANILKDVQTEIDYLHTLSVPDLKNLIQQAEAYLKQNEQDLVKVGLNRTKEEKAK